MKIKKIFNPAKVQFYRNKPLVSKAYQTTERISIAIIAGDNDTIYCKNI